MGVEASFGEQVVQSLSFHFLHTSKDIVFVHFWVVVTAFQVLTVETTKIKLMEDGFAIVHRIKLDKSAPESFRQIIVS